MKAEEHFSVTVCKQIFLKNKDVTTDSHYEKR